jgi:hypothetical protein
MILLPEPISSTCKQPHEPHPAVNDGTPPRFDPEGQISGESRFWQSWPKCSQSSILILVEFGGGVGRVERVCLFFANSTRSASNFVQFLIRIR